MPSTSGEVTAPSGTIAASTTIATSRGTDTRRNTASLNRKCPIRNRIGPPRITRVPAGVLCSVGRAMTRSSATAVRITPATIGRW